MPRPRKNRRICSVPASVEFVPHLEGTGEIPQDLKDTVIMTMDEYEAIRLIDHEHFSQEQCSEFMQVAGTTVQQIYASARSKLARMLVDGASLRIEGGEICLCQGSNPSCWKERCLRQEISDRYTREKGEQTMRIAIPYADGQIFQHFGQTEFFKVYDVEDGKIVSSQVISTEGNGHSTLAGILAALKADLLICGGIGPGAVNAMSAAGITVYAGNAGDADGAVAQYLAGNLVQNSQASCDHHDHEHHHEGHTCSSHGCHEHHQ